MILSFEMMMLMVILDPEPLRRLLKLVISKR